MFGVAASIASCISTDGFVPKVEEYSDIYDTILYAFTPCWGMFFKCTFFFIYLVMYIIFYFYGGGYYKVNINNRGCILWGSVS